MFNAERLLGKVISGAMQSGGRGHRSRGGNDLMGSLIGGLTSGKGLLTVIGLGIGAYETFKQSSDSRAAGTGTSLPPTPDGAQTAPPPPLPGSGQMPPVPPPHGASQSPPVPPVPPKPGSVSQPSPAPSAERTDMPSEDLAVRLIQTMIAAAYADGTMDEDEKMKILEQINQGGEIDAEERAFITEQLHNPLTIEQLTAGIDQPGIAQTMYMLAASAIVVDTELERQWLDRLAAALSISAEMQRSIEQQVA